MYLSTEKEAHVVIPGSIPFLQFNFGNEVEKCFTPDAAEQMRNTKWDIWTEDIGIPLDISESHLRGMQNWSWKERRTMWTQQWRRKRNTREKKIQKFCKNTFKFMIMTQCLHFMGEEPKSPGQLVWLPGIGSAVTPVMLPQVPYLTPLLHPLTEHITKNVLQALRLEQPAGKLGLQSQKMTNSW